MKKVLIVDDQPEVRELVEVTLRLENYELLQAKNGLEAVQLAKVEKPDLIIMDVMMPGEIDGLEATRRIKNNPETDGCRIIMLTAKGQETDKDKGFEAGADEYFTKPFSPLELIKKVENVLG
jgi:two-component system phosphate regulon response regulator PhoB